jgi:hypothetical protein
MAWKMTVDVVPQGGGFVEVQHVFYGESKADAEAVFQRHAEGCEFLGPAIVEGRVSSEFEEIEDDDWPEYEN